MRRALTIMLLVVVLIGLDVVFNNSRVSGGVYRGVVEFGRVVSRTASEMF